MFQSSPVPKDGRYLMKAGEPVVAMPVSILARPEGRALPSSKEIVAAVDWFQSSPVPKDGRYCRWIRRGLVGVRVSILARPEGRALHQSIQQ